MKYFFCVFLGVSALVWAQNVQNGTLEQWQTDTVYYYPSGWDGWFTTTAFGTFLDMPNGNVRPVSPGLQGNYSIYLENYNSPNGLVYGQAVLKQNNFTFSGTSFTVTLNATYVTTTADTASIYLLSATQAGVVTGYAELYVQHGGAQTSNNLVLTVPFNPLTLAPPANGVLYIVILAGDQPGSALTIDNITLSAGAGSNITQVADGGFEQWAPVTYDYPQQWSALFPASYVSTVQLTYNNNPVATLFLVDSVATSLKRSGDAYEGSFAARFYPQEYYLGTTPTLLSLMGYGGFSYSILPLPLMPYSGPANEKVDSLVFYYKTSNFNTNTDTIQVIVTLKNTNKTMTFDTLITTPNVSTYSRFAMDLSAYNDRPDSVGILFLFWAPTSSMGIWLQVDSIDFHTSPSIRQERPQETISLPYLFLSHGNFMLSGYPNDMEKLVIQLYTLDGKQVRTFEVQSPQRQIAKADLPTGLYVYRIIHPTTKQVVNKGKLVIR